MHITKGPDGALWFTEYSNDKVGRVSLSGGISEFPLPSYSAPSGIATGADGNLWIAETGSYKIARMTPSGNLTEYATIKPNRVIGGPDGNVWFTDFSTFDTMRVVTPQGVITEMRLPTLADSVVTDLAAGIADGNVWFTESAGNRLGRITPGGTVMRFSLPTSGSQPHSIVSGPDGNLWFTELSALGRMTPSGGLAEYPATSGAYPGEIASGTDGNLWFTESQGIGRITTDGAIWDVPLAFTPDDLVFGQDGNLWLTNSNDGKVARFLVP